MPRVDTLRSDRLRGEDVASDVTIPVKRNPAMGKAREGYQGALGDYGEFVVSLYLPAGAEIPENGITLSHSDFEKLTPIGSRATKCEHEEAFGPQAKGKPARNMLVVFTVPNTWDFESVTITG